MLQRTGSITVPPSIDSRSRSTSSVNADDEALRIGILVSEQDAEFGTNMYQTISVQDEPEIMRLISMGYSTDDAVYVIFSRTYRSRNPNAYVPVPNVSFNDPSCSYNYVFNIRMVMLVVQVQDLDLWRLVKVVGAIMVTITLTLPHLIEETIVIKVFSIDLHFFKELISHLHLILIDDNLVVVPTVAITMDMMTTELVEVLMVACVITMSRVQRSVRCIVVYDTVKKMWKD